jgi:hypothetical protein
MRTLNVETAMSTISTMSALSFLSLPCHLSPALHRNFLSFYAGNSGSRTCFAPACFAVTLAYLHLFPYYLLVPHSPLL